MRKKKILLVDDEEGFTRLLKLNLEQLGPYEVRVENWPDRALGVAHEFLPDLILLDVIMPHLPGVELAACIQADSALKRTPIVFLTATVSRGDDPIPVCACPNPCIPKPASIDEVIEGIEGNLPGKIRSKRPRSATGLPPDRRGKTTAATTPTRTPAETPLKP